MEQRINKLWANHKTTVLYHKGLYRHLHISFKNSHGMDTWVDITTWPGHLAITGDLTDGYIFSREQDMLRDFFYASKNEATGHTWLPLEYWQEKLIDTCKPQSTRYDSEAWWQWAQEILENTKDSPYYKHALEDYEEAYWRGMAAKEDEYDAVAYTRGTLMKLNPVVFEDAPFTALKDDYIRSCHLIYQAAKEYRLNNKEKN